MKAFAVEMLLLTSIMVAFADAALEEVMPAHVVSLRFLHTVQVLVFLGDGSSGPRWFLCGGGSS